MTALWKKKKKKKKLSPETRLSCYRVSRLQAADSVSKMKLQDLGLLIHWNIIYNLSRLAGIEVILYSVDVWLTEMRART